MREETDHSGLSSHIRELNRYLADIDRTYRTDKATEHSYRGLFQSLFTALTRGLSITNEPKRIACGAPDYIVTRGPIPLGYIEAKDISVGIHDKTNQAQFERYKEALPNLIITDYLNFELFTDGELTASVSIANFDGKGITPDKKQYAAFLSLIEAFTGYQGKTLANSESLAHIMAARTRLLAGAIEKALAASDGDDNDQIRSQLAGFRQVLIHDLGEREFADIYAQTLAYGMFAARLNDRTSEPFTRVKAASLIPLSNPFLRKFFYFIAGDLDERIAWIVDALADIFNCVSVEDILTEFAKQGQDPYIHFYETFLAEYNPRLRESRGVYYTPVPIVRFIVRAVDDILQKDFGLPRGLADNSKVTREGKEFHRVQILDPAAGTGTFLAEVIDQIYAKFAHQKGAWPLYCKENLIPRLNGFEILMASYAMAHFKLDMKLHETGYAGTGGERLRVYLTNTLEEATTKVAELPFAQWLSREAEEASAIKRDVPVLVVIANPPYNVSTQNRNHWIDGLISDYKKEPESGAKLKAQKLNLDDDYVKFIRFGQHLVERNQSGILAYISNNGYLDNVTFRGMRWNLLRTFDAITVINLHGNANKGEKAPDGSADENVFDIKQGTCITLFAKTGKKPKGSLAAVHYFDLQGRRKMKYTYLNDASLESVPSQTLSPASPYFFFVPKDFSGQEEYEKGFAVNELFRVFGPSIKTDRNKIAIHFTQESLRETINIFLRCDEHEIREKLAPGDDSRDWHLAWAKKDVETNQNSGKVIKLQFRPFDFRYTFFTGKANGFMCRPGTKIVRHFLDGGNLALLTSNSIPPNWDFNNVFVTSTIIDYDAIHHVFAFPLYLYPEDNGLDQSAGRTPNLDDKIVTAIAAKTGLRFVVEKAEKDGSADAFTPIDLLDYIYATLHSVKYRTQSAEFLKIDFPRVPYPESAGAFQRLAAFGATLRKLHLLDGVNPAQDYAAFPVAGDNIIDKAEWKRYADNTGSVHINKTQYFENVPEAVWSFYIGGYQPAQKWLKDRKGRSLDFDGIEHYQKIITALKLTLDIQAQIDGETGF